MLYGQPGVELTYYTSGGSGDAGDQYAGLDRFGRIVEQRWRKTSDSTDRERVKYGYDRAGNRQWRQNSVAGTGQDEYYTQCSENQRKRLKFDVMFHRGGARDTSGFPETRRRAGPAGLPVAGCPSGSKPGLTGRTSATAPAPGPARGPGLKSGPVGRPVCRAPFCTVTGSRLCILSIMIQPTQGQTRRPVRPEHNRGWIRPRLNRPASLSMAARLLSTVLASLCIADMSAAVSFVEIPAETLRDKIRGGLLGQMLGNLNGLAHEMKYIAEPGVVTGYVPALPEGAWTDDDTDFEWVYVFEMQRRDTILLPTTEIARLWRERINQRIWCSNQYARQLMDLGLEPPWTGNVLLNPWAEFNISGQFLCETFGLIAPAMPQTASRIGLHYTRVAIDGEPAQTTQLFDTMIARAFETDDIDALLDSGVAALDPRSVIRQIVEDVRRWHGESPNDWRTTRMKIKQGYSRYNGEMRDRNGYELNTACTIAALLHGRGDFARTLELAFNLGWDCDNNAATAGTILGVAKGYRWMLAQGWKIVDRYRNETRDRMPEDETITSFADRLIDLAEQIILEQGGQRVRKHGRWLFLIQAEPARNVEPLLDNAELAARMQAQFEPEIRKDLGSDDARARARGAYLAICLGLDDRFALETLGRWQAALSALVEFDQIAQALFHHSPVPAAASLQEKAIQAGLGRPAEKRNLW